jgi:hypothetical protein
LKQTLDTKWYLGFLPGVFKCVINGTWGFHIYHKMVPGVFKFIINGTLAQNNMFRNQPDETIEAVNKKKMNLTKKL